MKYLALTFSLASVLIVSACANPNSNQKSSWLCCEIPPQEWPARHWEYMAQENHIRAHDEILPAALDRDRSMFDTRDVENLSPGEFIQNLKKADIIENVYDEPKWWVFGKTGNHVVALDYNFYTLARADQVVITELLLQSYNTDFMILKDTHTQKTVGEITSDRGFVIF